MKRSILSATRVSGAAIALALAATIPATDMAAMAKPGTRPVAHGRIPARIASLPAGVQRPSTEVMLSKGQGQLVTLPVDVTDVFTSNPGVADVYVNNRHQIYLFGKDDGESTVFATTASGAVAYSTNVRVAQNSTSVDAMLKAAMPESQIRVVMAGQLAVLTGTVASPDDAQQAQQIVTAYLNPGIDVSKPDAQLKIGVVSRLRTATPLQVNLRVKIAEVSRALVKEIGVNLLTRDTTGGFNIGVAQGRNFGSIGTQDLSALPKLDASSLYGLPAGSISLPFDPQTGRFITQGATVGNFSNLGLGAGKTSIGLLGRLFGVDVASALDLAENDGLVTTLAQPNLTAVSGETASFLAGGEFPILSSQALGSVVIEYKQYGVSLAFTPTVLADGRISMRVRPEVSELTSEGSISLNGYNIPGLNVRRAETTVELGSGQSFVIGGLLNNSNTNSIDKAPGLGDVPILGAMFRSNKFKRQETELMIVVTPYLVKPVDASAVSLPTDGYTSPTDAERLLLGQSFGGHSGEHRPVPTTAPPTTVVRPQTGAALAPPAARPAKGQPVAAPGFSR